MSDRKIIQKIVGTRNIGGMRGLILKKRPITCQKPSKAGKNLSLI